MENRLVAVAGLSSGTLYYDALGRLSRLVSGGHSTQFLYDGDALVAEYLDGTLSRRYVHGDQVDEPLIEYQGTDLATRRYLHADHQGSIIAHSNTTGGVTQKNAYDPYGIPASTNAGRFGYTGQAWLKELGLNYYKARIYSPRLGRFLQTDPIFYEDDMNLYGYVAGDPINKADPTGTEVIASNCTRGDGGMHLCGFSSGPESRTNGKKDPKAKPGKIPTRALWLYPLKKYGERQIKRQVKAQKKYAAYVRQVLLAEYRVRKRGIANISEEHLSDDEVESAASGMKRAMIGLAVHRAVAAELAPLGWRYHPTAKYDFVHISSGVKVELTTRNPATVLEHIMRAPDIPIAGYNMESYDPD
jgi:RHS repeat-associated protein